MQNLLKGILVLILISNTFLTHTKAADLVEMDSFKKQVQCFVSASCMSQEAGINANLIVSVAFSGKRIQNNDDLLAILTEVNTAINEVDKSDLDTQNIFRLEKAFNQAISEHNQNASAYVRNRTLVGAGVGATLGLLFGVSVGLFGKATRPDNAAIGLAMVLDGFAFMSGIAVIAIGGTVGAGAGYVTGKVLSESELEQTIDLIK